MHAGNGEQRDEEEPIVRALDVGNVRMCHGVSCSSICYKFEHACDRMRELEKIPLKELTKGHGGREFRLIGRRWAETFQLYGGGLRR